ncbi:carbohydrate ABC transporter permease [Kineosporia babensis]|uniref:Carbohydrate ABC transporter permease n=1 Tax=Kineosporia babensis TaxID=499548 RepID=A0A9X1SXU3_9ACTN|nr:carbohydrate ABC transporter permease [Kineosporia babensis]MCD5315580.1 carbohydrate ABC transporter permease [Kineosporia babensis]
MSEQLVTDRPAGRPAGQTRSSAKKVRHAVSATLLWLVALLFLAPLIYTVATSLKPASDVFSVPPSLWGKEIRWQNYADALDYLPFHKFILNGLLVATAGTLITLVAASMSAYAFARLKFRGRNVLFAAFLATLMIPQEVLVVPMFSLMQEFGWVDSYQALILPWAFTAFGVFLMRQFFLTIPQELADAATVDGAGKFRTFFSVMLPLARPSLAVLAVFTFINYWNSFLWPLIITNSVEDKGTVPLGLSLFFSQQGSQWNLVMAASVISMVPTLLLLVMLRKHLVSGIATTGMGGR